MAKKQQGDYKHLFKRGGIWWIQAMHKGERIYKTTGTDVIKDAREIRDDELARFKLGNARDRIAIATSRIARIDKKLADLSDSRPAMTLLQAWEAFKIKPKGKTVRGRAILPGPRTLEDYAGRWSAFCDWMDETYPKKNADGNRIPWELRQIGKEHAERYIAEIGTTRSANTRNKTVTFLRMVFKVLSEDAKIKANPFDGMEAPRPAVSRKRPLTMAELAAVSKQLEGKGEMELLFSLGYYTGARLGDCALMRWDNIDMGGCKIRFTPQKTAKSNHEITLAIPPALFSLLDQKPKDKRLGLLLPELGALYKTRSGVAAVSKRVQQVFVDAGIETALKVTGYSRSVARVGFHSLRHAHITALLEGGVPMDVVRQQAGHASLDMTAHYYHASEKALRAVTDALPDMGKGNETGETKKAKLATVLGQLEALSDDQLAKVIKKSKEITTKRKKNAANIKTTITSTNPA